MSQSNTATCNSPAVVAVKEQEASHPDDEEVQMKHGKRNRDTEQKEDQQQQDEGIAHNKSANFLGEGNNNAACKDDEPEHQQEEKVREDSEEINEEEDAEDDDAVPLPSKADITTTEVEPTMKEFMALIRKKNDSVSWVGNYTTAHETKIEIGFLKKEAMALTTLMSYYQVDGDGATSCPVAMISGPASFGRKLAIFYSSLQKTTGRYYYWQRDKRDKVNLGLGFKMENQKLRTLAKLGRADFYIGTVKEFLEKGLRKKVVLQVTDQCRLKMNSHKVRSLGVGGYRAKYKFAEEMSDFVNEVFQSGQLDIVNLLITHIEFDADVLLALTTKVMNQGNVALAKFLLEKEPSLLDAPGYLIQLVSTAIIAKNLALVKMLVLDFGCDVNVEVDAHSKVRFLNIAVSGTQNYHYYYSQNSSGSLEVVEFLLDQGANVDVANRDGLTPLLAAIEAKNLEMVQLLISRYPEDTSLDLVAECGKGLALQPWRGTRATKEARVAWLEKGGLLGAKKSNEDQAEAAAATAGGGAGAGVRTVGGAP